jgi:hypothetical protein
MPSSGLRLNTWPDSLDTPHQKQTYTKRKYIK